MTFLHRQMHEMLQLLHQDVDSETGSYTDSGRGPSEEGDNNAHGNTLETHLGAESKSKSHAQRESLIPETLYRGDDALSSKPVMHYQDTAYLCY